MPIHNLSSTNAFIVFDLPDTPAAGIVRSAPKILQGGAEDLARSLTYAFASFEMQRGGASAGINAQPDGRADAVAAFVDEVTPMVADGSLSLGAAKGVSPDDLAPLRAADQRNAVADSAHGNDDLATHLAALGPVVAATHALGDLDGKNVIIEGFGAHGPALVDAVTARGASVVALSTAKGALLAPSGFEAADLRGRWTENGDAMVGDDAEPAWKVFATEADVLFVGSKMGAVNHETAGKLRVRALVPHAPLPFTTRALAVMQRGEIVVVPDFIATAGPLFAWWPSGDADAVSVIDTAGQAITSALEETAAHEDGAFLGACLRAESYLRSWCDELPFGRPLAS